jgi:hypothetical protein
VLFLGLKGSQGFSALKSAKIIDLISRIGVSPTLNLTLAIRLKDSSKATALSSSVNSSNKVGLQPFGLVLERFEDKS